MMRPMQISELQQPLGASLQGGDALFSSVSTDSRTCGPGDLFVALSGESFDGHSYVAELADCGVVAALVDRVIDTSLPQLKVADTAIALGCLGAYNRSLYESPVIAITGSSGKTTAKNMVHAVLSERGKTLATQGNFNNEIGVPLTLLRLTADYEFAVVEMGAARLGDIAWLRELGSPNISVLLNAMPSHLETFGSLESIVATKGEIFDDLGDAGIAIINADQPWAAQWRARAGNARVIDFGVQEEAAVTADNISMRGLAGSEFLARTPLGDILIELPLPGEHNVGNALAAIAVGIACELTLAEIRAGLQNVRPVAGRLSVTRTVGGLQVLDDCYNANPGSMRAAVDTLAATQGRRTLLLGAMLELGEVSVAAHAALGQYAREAGIDRLWGVGEELRATVASFGEGGRWFADRAAAIDALPYEFGAADAVLVKGSRGARMEQVLESLLNLFETGEETS